MSHPVQPSYQVADQRNRLSFAQLHVRHRLDICVEAAGDIKSETGHKLIQNIDK